MRLTGLWFAALAVFAGCAAAAPQGGSKGCFGDADCPNGWACYPDKSCYPKGTIVDCQPPCGGATPKCDRATLHCVACLVDADCPTSMLCVSDACRPGCSAKHPTCSPDGGHCDVDMGVCHGCLTDADCPGNDNPRCDKATGLCGPCLPDKDNCPSGRYCVAMTGGYRCAQGCKVMADCGVNGDACCDHQCTPTANDWMNCGACGKSCNGKNCCAGTCADLKADPANCGNCGTACQVQNGTPGCVMGVCGIQGCNSGFADCNKNLNDGCEAQLASDPNNCGGCGKACAQFANTSITCQSAKCNYTCLMGFRDCNNNLPKDGCEANLQSDVNNCGGCGNPCPAIKNGAGACVGGQCVIAMCNPGFRDCDKNVANGCEVQSDIDVNNCGSCGNLCPMVANGSPGCAGGMCIAICNAPFGDCDKNLGNGCETNLDFDLSNCGACGKGCPNVQNGQPGCDTGMCVILSCNPPFADCDGNPLNGCEANLNTNLANCGGCNIVCPGVQNGTPGCANGACGIGSCNAPFGDCDNNPGNGCETNLSNNTANCGQCGKACPMGQTCTNKVCGGGGGCLNGGKVPPLTCVNGADPENGATYTICSADCNTAWISATKMGGGLYHATQICNLYGYATLGTFGGTCGDVCGYCQANTTCNAHGPKSFDGGGTSCGADGFGQILCYTVMWNCLK